MAQIYLPCPNRQVDRPLMLHGNHEASVQEQESASTDQVLESIIYAHAYLIAKFDLYAMHYIVVLLGKLFAKIPLFD